MEPGKCGHGESDYESRNTAHVTILQRCRTFHYPDRASTSRRSGHPTHSTPAALFTLLLPLRVGPPAGSRVGLAHSGDVARHPVHPGQAVEVAAVLVLQLSLQKARWTRSIPLVMRRW